MATLESCTITFYTNGTGKEAGSHVTVTVKDDRNVVAASVSEEFGRFEEHTNNGPFDLAVLHGCKKGDLRRGSVTIRFAPRGDNQWRFNFFTALTFSDGTRLSGGKVELELNRDCNEQTFGIETITW